MRSPNELLQRREGRVRHDPVRSDRRCVGAREVVDGVAVIQIGVAGMDGVEVVAQPVDQVAGTARAPLDAAVLAILLRLEPDLRAADLFAAALSAAVIEGEAWMHRAGFSMGADVFVENNDIKHAQAQVGDVTWPAAYATDWIANEAKPAADIAADASTAPVQTDVEDAADEAARAAAAVTLQRAQAFIASGGAAQPFARHELARLLDECHATGVLQSDQDGTVLNDRTEVLFQFDPNSDLPDDLARAGSALLVHIVNTARTRHHADDLNPWPEPAPEGETLNDRLRRTGRAVQNLLVVHYDALQPDPASEAAYAEFSAALNALDRQVLAQAMAPEGEAA